MLSVQSHLKNPKNFSLKCKALQWSLYRNTVSFSSTKYAAYAHKHTDSCVICTNYIKLQYVSLCYMQFSTYSKVHATSVSAYFLLILRRQETLLLGKEITRGSPPLRTAKLRARPGKLPTSGFQLRSKLVTFLLTPFFTSFLMGNQRIKRFAINSSF